MRLPLPLFLLTLLGGAHVFGQGNVIKNADFEAPPADKNLPGGGWWFSVGRGEPEAILDRTVAHGGRASVRLRAKEDARCVVVSAPFDVSPGDELQFEGWVRCERPARSANAGNFGLAFRDAAGRIFERANVSTESGGAEWTLLSGKATVPANAVRAEMHLGYNDAPGTLWYDDVRAVITNPVSFSLATGAQAWTGPQIIKVRASNRATNPFQGIVHAVVARRTTEVPVTLAPGADQLIEVPITMTAVGQFDYTLSLVENGTAIRTVKGKFRTTAPLVLFPASPCYHVIGDRSDTRIDARVVVNPAERAGVKFVAALTDAEGKEIETATADATAGNIVGVTLHPPTNAAGRFGIVARLLNAEGQEIAKTNTDVHVRPPAEAEVGIGSDGFLRIDGRPHFTVGLYSAGRYEEMGRAGFTAAHNYNITTGEAGETINPNDAQVKELLDRAQANGMRLMVEFPRKAIEKAQWAQIRRRIETFRHHPGLLCWGSEERVARGDAPLAHIVALYRLVRELDPHHPFVLGDTREVIGKLQKDRRNFFPDEAMDVGIWWWYPIPLHGPDGNGLDGREAAGGLLQPPPWLTTTLSKKPLWIAIQSYQQPRKDARFPTPAEYRCMAFLSIINGVKGLWFYTGSGQRDWQGKPAGLLNKPEEGHWDYVQQLVRELRELEPAITAPVAAAKVAVAPATAPVEFTLREHAAALYLFAANKSERAQSVRFTSDALRGKKITVLQEDSSAPLTGDTLAADFVPFGTHVYRIE